MSQHRHTIKKIILGYILGLATLAGIAYASGQPEPSVGLYWYANSDPTIAPGVSAPMFQILIRTDINAVYWKSGGSNEAWTRIVGTGTGAGTVTSISCAANEGLLCTPNPITGAGTIGIAQLVTIQNEQINTETLAELDNYDPWHAGPHTTRVEIDPTQPNLLVTGIVAGNDGDLLWLWNGGNGGTNPNTITLPSQSASSIGANRFWIANGKLVNIPNNDGVLLIYDGGFGWTCFQCATSILRAQEFSMDPVAIPTALASSSSTNNYDPWTVAGIGMSGYVRQDVSGSGTATITGIIAAGAPNSEGRIVVWNNISAAGSTAFLNASSSSIGPNQILTPGGQTVTIGPGGSVIFIYDDTADAYRVMPYTIANAITGTGTANTVAKFTGTNTQGNTSITDNGTDVTTAEPIITSTFQLTSTGGPLWSPSASAPTGACTTGSIRSVTTSSANPSLYTCANSVWSALASGTVQSTDPLYSTGPQGTVVFDGTTTVLGIVPSGSVYTMTNDIAAQNITINVGVTIKTVNYAIFVSTSLTNNGTISNDGTSATTFAGGPTTPGARFGATAAGGNSVGVNSGAAPYPFMLTQVAATCAATAGATGGSGTSGKANGGAGGACGNAASAGSQGGAVTQSTYAATSTSLSNGLITVAGSSSQTYTYGSGGGEGNTCAAAPGGGGAGGGIVWVSAPSIAGTGLIHARGGNGSNAVNVHGGGGGGGGGGLVVLTYNTITGQTIDENGGTHGTGNGDGGNGGDGGSGVLIEFQL